MKYTIRLKVKKDNKNLIRRNVSLEKALSFFYDNIKSDESITFKKVVNEKKECIILNAGDSVKAKIILNV